MARAAFTIVGGVVGAFFGVPMLGAAIGGMIGNAVDPEHTQGPQITDAPVQTSAEGAPRTIIYGVASCTGNVIATGPLVVADVTTGGKGGSPVDSQQARRTYAIRICEGPIAMVLRIWENEKLVYDVRAGSLIIPESNEWLFGVGIHQGDETQLPDAFLNANVPPYEHPAYRGTAYMVVVFRDLTSSNGAIPQYRFEVAKEVTPSIITLPVVSARSMQGTTAGGSFTDFFITAAVLNTPGACWLATWYFEPTFTNSSITLQVKLNGAVIWSQAVSLTAGVHAQFAVQMNHASDGTSTWTAGWTGTFTSGNIRVNTNGISADYEAHGNNDLIYESTNPDFGLLVNLAGNLASAGPVGLSPEITWGPTTYENGYNGVDTTLDVIVADMHERCGVDSSFYDVSELADVVVHGLPLSMDGTAADVIDTCRSTYFFDKSEYDKKLWYPKRGKAVVDTIDFDDLVDAPDLSTRQQAVEFPQKLLLQYQQAASGYATAQASSARSSPDVALTSVSQTTVQTPFILTEDEAAQLAAKMHKIIWTESEGEMTFSVPESFINIVPSDCVGLSLRGLALRLRLEKVEQSDGVLNWTLMRDRQSAYTSSLTGIPIPNPTPPPPSLVGSTALIVADIGVRQDSEDDLNYLVAVSGAMPAWKGATVQRSTDGGANYTTVDTITTAARIGTLQNSITAANDGYIDTTNVVIVSLLRDGQELESISDAAFLSRGNAFLLAKADGTWEVMQFRDCVQDSNGFYHLSHLTRGRLHSISAAHASGAMFVMLEDMIHVPAQSAWIGQTLTHRAPSVGQSPELASPQTMTYLGNSQIEWPVASLSLARNASNIVSGTWAPRYRLGSDDAPVNSANMIGFRITIVGTSTVVLPDQTTNSFSYDASALGTSVTVSVQALNRITGAGPATTGII
jgi:hypothetical protein